MTDYNGGLMPLMTVFPVIKAHATQSRVRFPAETTAWFGPAPLAPAAGQ